MVKLNLKRKIFFLVFFQFLCISLIAQVEIRGTVKDAFDEPLIGVSVVEKGTTNGTETNLDGTFIFKPTSDQAIVVFSYLGFHTQEIAIKGQRNLDIVLHTNDQLLEEVVVVGFGTQKKANLTGSISTVSAKDLAKRQVGQTSMALQGVVPGMTITQRNGAPGADGGAITIRGQNSWTTSSGPLILVDGIEMNFNDIDPNLIESISVLKDAASSAIYGNRAANGVILVTTKRGENEKVSISYNNFFGWKSATSKPKKVNAVDHQRMLNQAYENVHQTPPFRTEDVDNYEKNHAENPDLYPDTDWVKETLKGSGFMQNHFVTIAAGGKKVRTLTSLGYYDEQGIIKNANFKRYTVRSSVDFDILKNLTVSADLHLSRSKRRNPARGAGAAFFWMVRIPSNQGGVLSDGKWGEGWNGDNPIAFTRDGGRQTIETPLTTLKFNAVYKPIKSLTIQANYAPTYREIHNTTFNKVVQTYYGDGRPGYTSPTLASMTDATTKYKQDILTATGTFEERFGGHGIKLMGGFQQETYRQDGHTGYRENYPFPDFPVLNAGGKENQKANGAKEDFNTRSFFGRLNYDYKERYLLEANIRHDGSSRFGKGNRWGTFPSFSGAWRISEESFWKPVVNTVDNLKLRASWGKLGNQNMPNPYPFATEVQLAGAGYVQNGKILDGAGINVMANPDISWETTTALNFGVDLTLFNKLHMSFDYYIKKTKDILMQLDIPLIVGLTAPWQNAGKSKNKGWDLDLTYTDHVGDFNYRVAFNLSDVRNKITDMKGTGGTQGLTVNREGHSMNSLYGLEAIGYVTKDDFDADGKYLHAEQKGDIAPGDIRYKDQNGDERIGAEDFKVIGGTFPRLTYGIALAGDYKGFDFSMLFQGVGRANGYIFGQGIQPFFQGGTALEMHKDNWTEDNPNARFPRLTFNTQNNYEQSSFWKRSASYFRMKNLQVGYSLPKNILSKLHVNRLRFFVSANNVFSIDNFWKGYDVEAPVTNGAYYPQTKDISFGLDINF